MAAILAYLMQDPTFSFDPRYYVYVIIGLTVFSSSLYRIVTRKYRFDGRVWHAASVALAGYTLVSWAKYLSGPAAIIMEVSLLAVSIGLLISKKSAVVRNYGRLPFGVILLIILSTSAPSVVFINSWNSPLIVVSPSNPYVTLATPGGSIAQDANVGSVYADSWSIFLTTTAVGQLGENPMLTTYINNTLGPFEIPFLQKGHQLPISLRIVSSPQTYNGTYNVVVGFKYQDLIGSPYSGSSTIQLTVGGGAGGKGGSGLPLVSYSVIGIAGFLALLTIAVLLRRVHNPRRKP